MEILAVFLMVGSAVGVAGRDVIRRWILREGVLTVSSFLVVTQAGTAALLLFVDGVLLFFGAPFRSSKNLFWIALLATVAVNVWIQYAGAKSSDFGEASLVGPVQSLTPGLVVIPALLLGELPSRQGWIGISTIIVGNFIHARAGEPLREWWKIFALLRLPRDYDVLGPREREKAWKNVRALRLGLRERHRRGRGSRLRRPHGAFRRRHARHNVEMASGFSYFSGGQNNQKKAGAVSR